jgi:hypothetical protein
MKDADADGSVEGNRADLFQTCILANRKPRNIKKISTTLRGKDGQTDGQTETTKTRGFPTYSFRLMRQKQSDGKQESFGENANSASIAQKHNRENTIK